MLHEPASSSGPDHAAEYKMRVGAYMFVLYGLIYAGFVVINLVSPLLMEKIIFLGLNVATVYGFGLILFALFLAMIYNSMCKTEETRVGGSSADKGGE